MPEKPSSLYATISRKKRKKTEKRLVISSVNCRTSNISKYINYHLQPIVQQIPSYIQDTSDFLQKINKLGKIQHTHI